MNVKYTRPRGGGGNLLLLTKPSNAQVVYQCKACPAGTYSNSETDYKCKKCDKGYYSDSAASTSCKKCPENFYSNEGFVKCEFPGCKHGQYLDKSTNSCENIPFPKSNFYYCYSSVCEDGTYSRNLKVDEQDIALLLRMNSNDSYTGWQQVSNIDSDGLYKIAFTETKQGRFNTNNIYTVIEYIVLVKNGSVPITRINGLNNSDFRLTIGKKIPNKDSILLPIFKGSHPKLFDGYLIFKSYKMPNHSVDTTK